MKRFFVLCLLLFAITFATQAQSSGSIAVHYDLPRQATLFAFNYSQPISTNVGLFGYIEYWKHNNVNALPLDAHDLYSKTWIQWSLTQTIILSSEIEWSYNNMSAYYKSTPFKPKTLYVMPKLGLSLKLW